MYHGDFISDDLVDIKFTTRDSSGAPATLSGTPVVSVYKDNSTTETTTGVTLTVDFDGQTGLNHVRVDTGADSGIYSAGSTFHLVITTGTVGGTSVVGEVVGSFSILGRNDEVNPVKLGGSEEALQNLVDLAAAHADESLFADIADVVLTRNWADVTATVSLHCVLNALRHTRNFEISGTTLTVYAEDGTTPAWTGTVSVDTETGHITGMLSDTP